MASSRHRMNFSQTVTRKIAEGAMLVCSNPGCLRFTGYSTTEGRPRAIAEAAHIIAASKKGPRASPASFPNDLKSAKNGIWLCLGCHQMIDDDPSFFPPTTLLKWKKAHGDAIRRIVGKDLESALLELRGIKQYHAECRELLSFVESKRVFYAAFDAERPRWVKESLDEFRTFIAHLRAKTSSGTILYHSLQHLQHSILNFLEKIGNETNLDTLTCNSNDPKWVRFCEELKTLRTGVVIITTHLANSCGYPLVWK